MPRRDADGGPVDRDDVLRGGAAGEDREPATTRHIARPLGECAPQSHPPPARAPRAMRQRMCCATDGGDVSPSIDSSAIRRYLLGSAGEDERAALEQRFFEDRDALDQMEAGEDELIESYLARRLDPGDRQRFETHYLASGPRRVRVETIRRLQAATDDVALRHDSSATRRSSAGVLARRGGDRDGCHRWMVGVPIASGCASGDFFFGGAGTRRTEDEKRAVVSSRSHCRPPACAASMNVRASLSRLERRSSPSIWTRRAPASVRPRHERPFERWTVATSGRRAPRSRTICPPLSRPGWKCRLIVSPPMTTSSRWFRWRALGLWLKSGGITCACGNEGRGTALVPRPSSYGQKPVLLTSDRVDTSATVLLRIVLVRGASDCKMRSVAVIDSGRLSTCPACEEHCR